MRYYVAVAQSPKID